VLSITFQTPFDCQIYLNLTPLWLPFIWRPVREAYPKSLFTLSFVLRPFEYFSIIFLRVFSSGIGKFIAISKHLKTASSYIKRMLSDKTFCANVYAKYLFAALNLAISHHFLAHYLQRVAANLR